MNKEQLFLLLNNAASVDTMNPNFSDSNSAAINAMMEFAGLNPNSSIREIQNAQPAVFAIIEEVLDRAVPAAIQPILQEFAEIKTYGRNDDVYFTLKNVGANRIAKGIVPGARGGIYRARRLDSRKLTVSTTVETVAYNVTLEEILSGSTTLSEIVALIAKGFADRIVVQVIRALRSGKADAPAANTAVASDADTMRVALDKVRRTVSAYGTPVIMGFGSTVDLIANPVANDADAMDIRNNGMVSIYKGTRIVRLPNFFMDEGNTEWAYNEQDLFVFPTAEKPVKIAFKGETYIAEVAQPHGGKEWHTHRLVGVALAYSNSLGYVTVADAQAGVY